MSHPVNQLKMEATRISNNTVRIVVFFNGRGKLATAALNEGFQPSHKTLNSGSGFALQKDLVLFGTHPTETFLKEAKSEIEVAYNELTEIPTLIDSKNQLLSLLHDEYDSKQLLLNVETVVQTLALTFGMFVECDYAYKAAEMLNVCSEICGNFKMETSNSKRLDKLSALQLAACQLADKFHQAQHSN